MAFALFTLCAFVASLLLGMLPSCDAYPLVLASATDVVLQDDSRNNSPTVPVQHYKRNSGMARSTIFWIVILLIIFLGTLAVLRCVYVYNPTTFRMVTRILRAEEHPPTPPHITRARTPIRTSGSFIRKPGPSSPSSPIPRETTSEAFCHASTSPISNPETPTSANAPIFPIGELVPPPSFVYAGSHFDDHTGNVTRL